MIPSKTNIYQEFIIAEEEAYEAVLNGNLSELLYLLKTHPFEDASLAGCLEMLGHAPTSEAIVECLLKGLSNSNYHVREGAMYGSLSHLHNTAIRSKLIDLIDDNMIGETITDILNEHWMGSKNKFTLFLPELKCYYGFRNLTYPCWALITCFGMITVLWIALG